jgi:hypothetical protein
MLKSLGWCNVARIPKPLVLDDVSACMNEQVNTATSASIKELPVGEQTRKHKKKQENTTKPNKKAREP